jgi:hypothetical protein
MLYAGQLISQLLQNGVTQSFPQEAPGYAVGWGSLALINAGLAQGKSRSGLLFFFISLLLGPIATLIIVLLPKPNPSP